MGITSILRDWADGVSIVRIISTNTLSEVAENDYLDEQKFTIHLLNSGPFGWVNSDVVLVAAIDGWGFFTISSDFSSLNVLSPVGGTTGTGNYVLQNNPTIDQPNIFGITNGNPVEAGCIGEQISYTSSIDSQILIDSNVVTGLGSILLTPGIWQVTGDMYTNPVQNQAMVIQGWSSANQIDRPDMLLTTQLLLPESIFANEICVPLYARTYNLIEPTIIFFNMYANFDESGGNYAYIAGTITGTRIA